MKKYFALLSLLVLAACYGRDKSITEIYLINAEGLSKKIGTIEMQDTPQGLQLAVDLQGLPQGKHGFHVHETGDCGADTDSTGKMTAELKAKGHYDPDKTAQHLGPDKNGHKGDLPYLSADKEQKVKQTVYAPHLKLSEIKGRSLMIHEGGDNYQDTPAPLGGGGARIACGVVK